MKTLKSYAEIKKKMSGRRRERERERKREIGIGERRREM
jgi:hypothetical protein